MVKEEGFTVKHFRIISIFLLILLIFFLSVTTNTKTERLPFETYEFDIGGSGSISEVFVTFDYSKKEYFVNMLMGPGNFTIHSDMVLSGSNCMSNYECPVFLEKEQNITFFLDQDNGFYPNGRFVFYFCNQTSLDVLFVFGKEFLFDDLRSVLPQSIHAEYYYDSKGDYVLVNTHKNIKYGDYTSFADFALYSVDAKNKQINQNNEWRNDFLLVPALVALFILVLSDAIDVLHIHIVRRKKKK